MYFYALLFACLFFSHVDAKFAVQDDDITFWVVIPSYNNERYVEENLTSLFKQDYPKWEMVYINDASTDQTYNKALSLIKKYGKEHACQIISNKTRSGAMANIYKGAHLADAKKVVVLLDGDDALKGKKVLSFIAKLYRNKKVWMTYGNYEADPKTAWTNDPCIAIPKDVKKNKSYRSSSFIYYPLRTFYAKLFHKIKFEHLQYNGAFLPVVSDTGYMLPMLEMAANDHIKYVDKILYIYHVDNPQNDFKSKLELMKEISHHLRQIPPYKPLKKLFKDES